MEILRAVKLYAGSHYGSNLWQLDSDSTAQYYSGWRTCVKLALQVRRQTHTYFVDHLLSCSSTSVRMDIFTRIVKFVKGLQASPSMEVAVMCAVVSGDVQSTTGRNLHFLGWEVGLNPMGISLGRVKEVLGGRLKAIPEVENWRVEYLG